MQGVSFARQFLAGRLVYLSRPSCICRHSFPSKPNIVASNIYAQRSRPLIAAANNKQERRDQTRKVEVVLALLLLPAKPKLFQKVHGIVATLSAWHGLIVLPCADSFSQRNPILHITTSPSGDNENLTHHDETFPSSAASISREQGIKKERLEN